MQKSGVDMYRTQTYKGQRWGELSKTKSVKSKVIGELWEHEELSNSWYSSDIEIPFLDNDKLVINFEFEPGTDNTFLEEADKALSNFLALTVQDRYAISKLVFRNCKEFMESAGEEEFDEDLQKLKKEKEVWQFVTPTEICVSRRDRRDKDIYIQLLCECAWEEEHGLQLVFRQGKKITRVSDQDGHLTESDAYNWPDTKDKLLSKY